MQCCKFLILELTRTTYGKLNAAAGIWNPQLHDKATAFSAKDFHSETSFRTRQASIGQQIRHSCPPSRVLATLQVARRGLHLTTTPA